VIGGERPSYALVDPELCVRRERRLGGVVILDRVDETEDGLAREVVEVEMARAADPSMRACVHETHRPLDEPVAGGDVPRLGAETQGYLLLGRKRFRFLAQPHGLSR
jgi:hypothetical protein